MFLISFVLNYILKQIVPATSLVVSLSHYKHTFVNAKPVQVQFGDPAIRVS